MFSCMFLSFVVYKKTYTKQVGHTKIYIVLPDELLQCVISFFPSWRGPLITIWRKINNIDIGVMIRSNRYNKYTGIFSSILFLFCFFYNVGQIYDFCCSSKLTWFNKGSVWSLEALIFFNPRDIIGHLN